MEIIRDIYKKLLRKIEKGKVLVLYGPRRAGKTHLLEKLMEEFKNTEKIAYFKGDYKVVKDGLSEQNFEKLMSFVGKETTLLIVDEVQKVPNAGESLKILVDNWPSLKIVVSGSSSLGMGQVLGEPLTGRQKRLSLFPVSAKEVVETNDMQTYKELFEDLLIYGGYPETFLKKNYVEKGDYLMTLVEDYLYKDILELENVRNSAKIRDLLTLIAFQIGKEVSVRELGSRLNLHVSTVVKYLDLLEKCFVLINIRGFSRNLRKEVYNNSRWYFYDNGVRNALIGNFNRLAMRDDIGQLWENYVVIERLKKQKCEEMISKNYFWRTYDKKEIDWVEEREGKLFGYEIKWSNAKKVKVPKVWLETYKNASFEVIDRDNYLGFVM